MTFLGFLTFSDPPKGDVEHALHELAGLGISLRMITATTGWWPRISQRPSGSAMNRW